MDGIFLDMLSVPLIVTKACRSPESEIQDFEIVYIGKKLAVFTCNHVHTGDFLHKNSTIKILDRDWFPVLTEVLKTGKPYQGIHFSNRIQIGFNVIIQKFNDDLCFIMVTDIASRTAIDQESKLLHLSDFTICIPGEIDFLSEIEK